MKLHVAALSGPERAARLIEHLRALLQRARRLPDAAQHLLRLAIGHDVPSRVRRAASGTEAAPHVSRLRRAREPAPRVQELRPRLHRGACRAHRLPGLAVLREHRADTAREAADPVGDAARGAERVSFGSVADPLGELPDSLDEVAGGLPGIRAATGRVVVAVVAHALRLSLVGCRRR